MKIIPSRDPSRLALLWAQSAARSFQRLTSVDPDKEPSPEQVKGFIDGLKRRTVPYPAHGTDLPGIRPCFNKDYEAGYTAGESFADAAEVFTHPEVAEKWLPMKFESLS